MMGLRICYIAGREGEYSRTRIIRRGLEIAGFEVIPIFPPDRAFRHYPGLMWKFLKYRHGHDVVLVGFYGQLLLPVVRFLTRKPILYDIYISTYDTMVYDRERAKPGSFMSWLYCFFDRLSMFLADRIILETGDHIRDYSKKFRIPEKKFEHVFLAVDENVIHPKHCREKNEKFLVHFHGEFAPFHGVCYILGAARLLQEEGVVFQIIGRGITYQRDRALAKKLALKNVRFIDWVPYEQLADTMASANCCLGIFGDNPRTLRVLTNKVVETLAVGKPLISAKNQPIQELVKDGESGLLVNRADSEAIARAILRLKDDPGLGKRIGENGYRIFLKHCSMKVFSERLKTIIQMMVAP